MGTLELHPSQGGADAESFAHELGTAIAKHSGVALHREGKIYLLHRL